jgi:hypothetical protein
LVTRASSLPDRSSAATVFSKFGAAASAAIVAISALCSASARSKAG